MSKKENLVEEAEQVVAEDESKGYKIAAIDVLKRKKTVDGVEQEFRKIKLTVVNLDNGRTYSGEMSLDFAKDYFTQCGVSSKDCVGRKVNVVLGRNTFENANGDLVTYTFAKLINFLDGEGNPIIPASASVSEKKMLLDELDF